MTSAFRCHIPLAIALLAVSSAANGQAPPPHIEALDSVSPGFSGVRRLAVRRFALK